MVERPEIPVSILLIFLFFITFSAQTQETMDATIRYCLVAVASLSFGILIVSCIRILWNKLNEGRAEENAINNQINQIRPPSPPITIYTITTLPNLNDFSGNTSPLSPPDYRNALLNAAVLHFMDEKTKV
uniref:ATP synthase protein MI25 n=1 Tax=Panagrolaimus sp. PS1159 TaxID=55785 RepID=A0AC35GGU0_9BILA